MHTRMPVNMDQVNMMRPGLKLLMAMLIAASVYPARANSFGFSQDVYSSNNGSVSVTLTYDFTDFSMLGAGIDVVYDAEALEFVSYTQATLPGDIWFPAAGSLAGPGLYSGIGLGTKFFNGISSAGTVGMFEFVVLGATDSTATPCGMTLCVMPNIFNPFIDLIGNDVTEEILSNSITSAAVVVPVPAAMWLMLGGLGLVMGVSTRT